MEAAAKSPHHAHGLESKGSNTMIEERERGFESLKSKIQDIRSFL